MNSTHNESRADVLFLKEANWLKGQDMIIS